VVVKFRDDMSTAARLAALASPLRRRVLPRVPSYADFDVVTIGANDDCRVGGARAG